MPTPWDYRPRDRSLCLRVAAVTIGKTKAELIDMVREDAVEHDGDIFFSTMKSLDDLSLQLGAWREAVDAANSPILVALSTVAVAQEEGHA